MLAQLAVVGLLAASAAGSLAATPSSAPQVRASQETAVLTTRLPGMPSEYLEHVLTIDEPGPAGVSQGLAKALAEGRDGLLRRGERGRAFVLEHKNNVHQASRILGLAQQAAG